MIESGVNVICFPLNGTSARMRSIKSNTRCRLKKRKRYSMMIRHWSLTIRIIRSMKKDLLSWEWAWKQICWSCVIATARPIRWSALSLPEKRRKQNPDTMKEGEDTWEKNTIFLKQNAIHMQRSLKARWPLILTLKSSVISRSRQCPAGFRIRHWSTFIWRTACGIKSSWICCGAEQLHIGQTAPDWYCFISSTFSVLPVKSPTIFCLFA